MDQSIVPSVVPEPPKRSFPKWPLIALFSFFFGIASVLAYQKYLPSRFNLVGPSSSPQVSPAVSPAIQSGSLVSLCQAVGGTWIGDGINECESPTLPEEFCRENGGIFSECLSPCRHSSPLLMCADVCMRVCKF